MRSSHFWFIWGVLLLAGSVQVVSADEGYAYTTQWGSGWGTGEGQFTYPEGVAVDSAGNVYVADTGNNRVQKFTSTGTFITQWGGRGDRLFSGPRGIAVDSAGDVYVTDDGNSQIQKFTSDGTFITKWGSLGSGDGQLHWPGDLAVDGAGNVYVVDTGNHRVQKFSSSGTFITSWLFLYLSGVAVDSAGNVYITDGRYDQVQKFTSNGTFITQWGSEGSGDGQFKNPSGVAVDSAGNVYITDTGNERVQKFTADGTFITQWNTSGSGDGPFRFSSYSVAVDGAGDVYVVDSSHHRIEKFTSDGTFITQWGNSGSGNGQFYYPHSITVDSAGNVYVADGPDIRVQTFTANGTFIAKWGRYGSVEMFYDYPHGIAVDSTGNVYAVDTWKHAYNEYNTSPWVQKFTPAGISITKWGSNGQGDGLFNRPHGIAVDSTGDVYVADTMNNRVQKFDANGIFITKWGTEGTGDGQFTYPEGVAVDSAGNVYVTDTGNSRIQKFTANGTFIAQWGSEGAGDGQFTRPGGVAVDSAGNVFVVDTGNSRIQKFDANGTFITKFGSSGSGDGQFTRPGGVAVDSAGNVYVADTGNNRVQKFAPVATPEVTPPPNLPYRPHTAPGLIEAEDYDRSTGEWSGCCYSDTTAGNSGGAYRQDDVDIETAGGITDVGWIQDGEYLVYSVDAASAGDYTLALRASNPDAVTKTVNLSASGLSTTVRVPSTGSFDTYVDAPAAGTIRLKQGRNIIQVTFSASRMNLDYITIGTGVPLTLQADFLVLTTPGSTRVWITDTSVNAATVRYDLGDGVASRNIPAKGPVLSYYYSTAGTYTITQTATGATGETATRQVTVAVGVPPTTPGVETPYKPHDLPIIVEAEDFDNGGEGVAYHDTTPGNAGGSYRPGEGVEITNISGGGYAVGSIESGEWLNYMITSPENSISDPDPYPVDFYVASTENGRSIRVEVDGTVVRNVSVPNTGSLSNFQPVFTQLMFSDAPHTIRLVFNGDGQSLDKMVFWDRRPSVLADGYAVANFTPDTTGGTAPLTVHFTDTSPDEQYIMQWHWAFGDGETSEEQNPTHTYLQPGVYTANLTIDEESHWYKLTHDGPIGLGWFEFWDMLRDHGKKSQTITVTGAPAATPVADFTVTPLGGPGSKEIQVIDTSVNATSVRYDLGDGTVTGLTGFRYTYWQSGIYTITLTATNAAGSSVKKVQVYAPAVPPVTPSIVIGSPYIPGILQAEDYDLGGEGVAFHDTTPGNEGGAYRHDDVDIETANGVTDVGWIRDGEWLTYTVSVTRAGTYNLAASVASPNDGRMVAISVDGVKKVGLSVWNTGSFEAFRTTSTLVMLPAGTHTLTLTFQGDGQNLDWVELTPFVPPTQTTPMPDGST